VFTAPWKQAPLSPFFTVRGWGRRRRQEARIITDLVWLFMDKVQAIKAKEQCDEK